MERTRGEKKMQDMSIIIEAADGSTVTVEGTYQTASRVLRALAGMATDRAERARSGKAKAEEVFSAEPDPERPHRCEHHGGALREAVEADPPPPAGPSELQIWPLPEAMVPSAPKRRKVNRFIRSDIVACFKTHGGRRCTSGRWRRGLGRHLNG